MSRIPATVLTGFLGSGKSTLLRRVLTEAHGRRIAVIENEFGEENIDSEIIVTVGTEQIVRMSNGCVCCSIRDDLRATLLDLSEKRNTGELQFDQVMIETTGLADPGPVAQTFFLDETIASLYRPDAILTMVDARHGMDQLNQRWEARRQVGFADRIFISKTDLVDQEDVRVLSERVRKMNPRAPQFLVPFGNVPLQEVFDVGGFNLNEEFTADSDGPAQTQVGCAQHHHHDDVKGFVFRSERSIHGGRFGQFMNAMINSLGPRLLRYKGILNMLGSDRRVILQGVHQLMSHDLGSPWGDAEPRVSKLVFIGIELPNDMILRSLQQCLV